MGQLYPGSYYNGQSSTVSNRINHPMSPVVGDGITTVFTVTGTVPASIPSYIDVYLNGVFQQYMVDYTLNSSGVSFVVTFTTAPAINDIPEAVY